MYKGPSGNIYNNKYDENYVLCEPKTIVMKFIVLEKSCTSFLNHIRYIIKFLVGLPVSLKCF